jgi:hypothetical protein
MSGLTEERRFAIALELTRRMLRADLLDELEWLREGVRELQLRA